MAKLRVFLSSTYYDFRHVRVDLERFIRDQGYEPVLNEHGHIPYGSTEELENYCYKEIEHCDILVSIIGGRFGSTSKDSGYSISNIELKTAILKGKQVYIFIEESVHIEYRTYLANKENEKINYSAVDNVAIYKFIEEILSLSSNNQVKSFDSIPTITGYLKEQWSGLFQKLINEKEKQREFSLIEKLSDTAETLDKLVKRFTLENIKTDQSIQEIVFTNHPIFKSLSKILKIPHRIIFLNIKELEDLLKHKGFSRVADARYSDYFSYQNMNFDRLHLSKDLFDKNTLKVIHPADWHESNLVYEESDDVPF